MDLRSYAWLLLALPLLGFVITGGLGRHLPRVLTGVVGSSVIGLSFLVSVAVFVHVLGQAPHARVDNIVYYRWAETGLFHLDVGFLIDPLTCVMLLFVTGVSFLIHVYSIGYMGHDANVSRFFSYLNLFVFSMLLLVLADNYLILIIGWGMVGLCSYLLIGFWFDRPSAVLAARKAFVMNVIGDVGMMIAAYLMFVRFGTLSYDGVFSKAQYLKPDTGLMNAICLGLLLGATAKSAQIPLYTWLPDAMEGPTPVSALIHAATMVTAGVYLIARSHVLYHLAPFSLALVAIIGAVGALYAASIGLVQTDIKRVLAYSTISQIGYMFLGCGVGAYSAGIFHVVTHAFFKALLFLGAGNVIHALADEQDMRQMGGLRSTLRATYWLMMIACLSISAFPPFAGFFSKDEILGRVLAAGHWFVTLWVLGIITSGLTAFYMFRLLFLTFHGTYNGPREVYAQAHEAPAVMLVPLALLGLGSVAAGWLQVPGGWHLFDDFLAPVFTRYPAAHAGLAPATTNWVGIGVAVAVALAGLMLAFYMYGGPARRPYRGLTALYQVLAHKYYVDEIYDETFVRPVRAGARVLYSVVDRAGVDGVVDGAARTIRPVSVSLSPLESGYVRAYVLAIFAGAVLVVLVPVLFATLGK